MEVFKDNDLPEPTTLVEFTAQVSSQAALEAGKGFYVDTMEALVGGERPFLKTVHMEAEHNKAKVKATQLYLEKNKYGRKNQTVVEKYEILLHEELDNMYSKYSQLNEAKNVFKAARTPATLFSVLMFFYLMSGVFGLFGMYAFANLCNLSMGAFLVMLAVWAYARYSGEYRDAGGYIDELATFLWENVIHPLYQTYMERHLREAAEHAAQHAITNSLSNGKLKTT
ncbi:hypothetical protein Pmani_036130 [Petrolisthes manimaculis]|uniref:Atlastin n=1 Tax=Petrolisthes manimaculis TaxID=1843537 RepID=A0AAE1TME8_9EUCA|nr:hypothetical protein Pmani_036130 [Petrolisthes manimaculis]